MTVSLPCLLHSSIWCRVKKLDRRSDLAVRQLADLPSHCRDALVHPVPVYVLATPPARPLRPRRAGSREGRAPPPTQGPPSRPRASRVHHSRSGLPGGVGSGAVPGPVEELPGRSGHPGEMAPGSAEEARAGLAPAGSPSRDPSIKHLILRLGRENPRWGYLRIRGELLKLGIDFSATTIATVLRQGGLGPAPRRIGPTWAQFLRLQAYGLLYA